MGTYLFPRIIFGPVYSRRLGHSLGINLQPQGCKVCTFNCPYCECGLTIPKPDHKDYPDYDLVVDALEHKLHSLSNSGQAPDYITFAGNGEPTMHPDFAHIIHAVYKLRNQYFPDTKIAVLSNSTLLMHKDVARALQLADLNMLKLDAGTEEGFHLINRPQTAVTLDEITSALQSFDGNYVIQTMLMKGVVDGMGVDNSRGPELEAWINRLGRLNPEYVMIYSLARSAPSSDVERVPRSQLEDIAVRVKKRTGLRVEVY